MRPLHWGKLPDIKVPGTIWVDTSLSDGIGLDDANAGLDTAALEEAFGLGGRARTVSRPEAEPAGGVTAKKKKEEVQLFDMKRSNNVAIALSRIRLSDEQIKEAVLDPVAHPLSVEQISALLGVLPTAEEVETIKDYAGEASALGRVEHFFLVLADIERLQARLQALQAEKQFMPQWETLSEEIHTVVTATEQVRNSPALKSVLLRVLALGNYLNGTSARGGAYGFKLSDLAKLVQVKSADSKTTLLHYLARFLSSKSAGAIDELKAQLNALPEAIGIPMNDKKAELNKLSASFKLAEQQQKASDASTDSLSRLLEEFCGEKAAKLSQLEQDFKKAEERLADLAKWLAEKPSATTEELFAPLAEFVKTLDKAQQDNVREEEAARRAANRPAVAPGRPGMRPVGGMGGPPPGIPGLGDKNMMLEMQLKMAKRAEKASEGNDNEIKQQQAQLLARQALASRSAKKSDDLGVDLANSLASGSLFAARRAAAGNGSSK